MYRLRKGSIRWRFGPHNKWSPGRLGTGILESESPAVFQQLLSQTCVQPTAAQIGGRKVFVTNHTVSYLFLDPSGDAGGGAHRDPEQAWLLQRCLLPTQRQRQKVLGSDPSSLSPSVRSRQELF